MLLVYSLSIVTIKMALFAKYQIIDQCCVSHLKAARPPKSFAMTMTSSTIYFGTVNTADMYNDGQTT